MKVKLQFHVASTIPDLTLQHKGTPPPPSKKKRLHIPLPNPSLGHFKPGENPWGGLGLAMDTARPDTREVPFSCISTFLEQRKEWNCEFANEGLQSKKCLCWHTTRARGYAYDQNNQRVPLCSSSLKHIKWQQTENFNHFFPALRRRCDKRYPLCLINFRHSYRDERGVRKYTVQSCFHNQTIYLWINNSRQ